MNAHDDYGYEQDADFIKPPLWPKVLGVVCMVFGGLGLTCGGLGLLTSPISAKFMTPMFEGDPMMPSLVFGPVDYLLGGINLLLAVVLLFGGITLFARRPLGRTLLLLYSIPTMPLVIYQMIRTFEKQAADIQWAKDFPNNPIAQGMNQGGAGQQIGQMVGMGIFVVLGLGFPLFLFIWFAAIKTKPIQITGTEDGVV